MAKVTLAELEKKLSPQLKELVSVFRSELSTMKQQLLKDLRAELITSIKNKDDEIKKLNSEIDQFKKVNIALRREVEDAQSYSRRDCAIIFGPAIPAGVRNENSTEIAVNLLQNKFKMNIDEKEISTAHRVGPKPTAGPDNRKFVVKFCRRDTRRKMFLAAKANRDSGLSAGECLTPQSRSIFYSLRKIRKMHGSIITGCSTFDGRVYAYTKSADPNARRDVRHLIDSQEKLASLCREHIKKNLESFLEEWQL